MAAPRLETKGFVYFITDGEAFKIGFSTDPHKRMRSLQSAHHFPLEMIGSYAATRREEMAIHKRFKHLHIRGEWFRIDDAITDMIDTLEDQGRLVERREHRENFLVRNVPPDMR